MLLDGIVPGGVQQGQASAVVIPVAGGTRRGTRRAQGGEVSPLRIEDEAICLTSDGEARREGREGYAGFIHMFSEPRKAAGIDGVSFGDLRGTAVTRLALAGCTAPDWRSAPSPGTATRTPT
jgi:hypothetical protein